MSTITKRQAEAALEQIKIQFKAYIELGYSPKLVEGWDWLDSGPTPWAIVWEEGPFEWAYRAKDGGTDEELTTEAHTITGMEKAIITNEPAPAWPDGVWCEPVTSWAIGLYPT